jgi:hypothetical protein
MKILYRVDHFWKEFSQFPVFVEVIFRTFIGNSSFFSFLRLHFVLHTILAAYILVQNYDPFTFFPHSRNYYFHNLRTQCTQNSCQYLPTSYIMLKLIFLIGALVKIFSSYSVLSYFLPFSLKLSCFAALHRMNKWAFN